MLMFYADDQCAAPTRFTPLDTTVLTLTGWLTICWYPVKFERV